MHEIDLYFKRRAMKKKSPFSGLGIGGLPEVSVRIYRWYRRLVCPHGLPSTSSYRFTGQGGHGQAGLMSKTPGVRI